MLFAVSVLPTEGQGLLTANAASVPTLIPIPVATGVLGRRDPAALTEITSHLAVVGSVAWTGMQGTGTMTFGPDLAEASNATLTNMAGDRYRLDIAASKGPISERVHGLLGKTQGSNGIQSVIPADTALAGFFPFELLRVVLNPKSSSVIDHGIVTIDSTPYHLLTLEFATLGRNPLTRSQNTVAIDFYLNPISHLLVKTAYQVISGPGQRVKLLSVVTYEDYRSVNGALIPFRFTETLEGQQSQALQLSNVQLSPSIDKAFFDF